MYIIIFARRINDKSLFTNTHASLTLTSLSVCATKYSNSFFSLLTSIWNVRFEKMALWFVKKWRKKAHSPQVMSKRVSSSLSRAFHLDEIHTMNVDVWILSLSVSVPSFEHTYVRNAITSICCRCGVCAVSKKEYTNARTSKLKRCNELIQVWNNAESALLFACTVSPYMNGRVFVSALLMCANVTWWFDSLYETLLLLLLVLLMQHTKKVKPKTVEKANIGKQRQQRT